MLLFKQKYVVYDYFPPNTEESFPLRIEDAPSAAKKANWEIVDAAVRNN